MADDLLADYRRDLADVKRERDDLKKALDKREEDNKGYRDRIKALEQESENLKTKLPPEGSTLLSKADQARFDAYKVLGAVDEVVAKVKGYDSLDAKDKRRDREDGIKGLNLKPSIFELIAEGKPYRAEGEGEDQTIYLSVEADGSEKEVELTQYASERGLGDLLGVMGLEAKDKTPAPKVPTGAGSKPPGKRPVLDADASYREKRNNPAYRG